MLSENPAQAGGAKLQGPIGSASCNLSAGNRRLISRVGIAALRLQSCGFAFPKILKKLVKRG